MKYSLPNPNFMRGAIGCFLKNAILIWLTVFSIQLVYAERLYVFYPSTVRTQVMQKELTNALPGIDIRVFGRYRDFKAKTKSDSPDMILSKPPVIKSLPKYSINLQGSKRRKTKEAYVLLSVTKNIKLNPANMAGMTVGAFDILGRKGMKKFIGKYLKANPKIKRVSKVEDLLQLLTFNMVKAILIPKIHIKYFKGISKLHFKVTPVPKMRIGIIALAVKNNGNAANTLKAFTNINNKVRALLDIDNLEVK